jgi:hypothetical protein
MSLIAPQDAAFLLGKPRGSRRMWPALPSTSCRRAPTPTMSAGYTTSCAVFGATGCGDFVVRRMPAGTGSDENRVRVGEVWTCLTIPIISTICTVVRG